MAKSNPNGVNQYTAPDPRQQLFLKYYLDPKSKTFSNSYQSALKAGYEDEYAKVVLSKDLDWLSSIIKDEHLIKKAEKNLDIFLDGEDEKIKADITKFVLTRLNKQKYSERTETDITSGGQVITGFNYIKPDERINPDNQTPTEARPSVD